MAMVKRTAAPLVALVFVTHNLFVCKGHSAPGQPLPSKGEYLFAQNPLVVPFPSVPLSRVHRNIGSS